MRKRQPNPDRGILRALDQLELWHAAGEPDCDEQEYCDHLNEQERNETLAEAYREREGDKASWRKPG